MQPTQTQQSREAQYREAIKQNPPRPHYTDRDPYMQKHNIGYEQQAIQYSGPSLTAHGGHYAG